MDCRLNLLNFLPMLLTNILLVIVNHDILRSYFSDGAKKALVRPIYEKIDRQNKENYRPVSILNGFSKVYKRFIYDSMLPINKPFCQTLPQFTENTSVETMCLEN